MQEKMIAAARDELFSHINRCGVLMAEPDDQGIWMDETIEYIGERYPDLTEADLQGLHAVGMRFCQPTINNISRDVTEDASDEAETSADEEGEVVTAGASGEGEALA